MKSALFAVAVLLATTAASAQAPVVEKVDPPNWWTGSSVNPVRVLIRGKNLAGARASCLRVTCSRLKVNAAGTYVFVDVTLPAGLVPGRYPFRLVTPGGSA